MTDFTYYKMYSTTEEKEAYRRGYFQGYQAGYADGKEEKSEMAMVSDDVAGLPIEVIGLSTRAYNCLHRSGCRFVSDVIRLSETQILQMRNLGKVTAREIAGVLENLGIHGTHWATYLY